MQNTSATFSCYHSSVLGYRYIAVSWGVVVAVTGTVGNVLTLLALAVQPKLRTHFNLLIANLSVADLLYCTFLQPFSVDTYLHLQWRTGATFCKVFGFLLFASNAVSILTLCLIALARYLLIAHPMLFPQVFSAKGILLALVGTWVVGMASFAPLWPTYTLVPVVCTCSFKRSKEQTYAPILMGIYFVLGLSSVGIFYCLIYHQVKRAAQALDQYKQPSVHSNHMARTEAIPGRFQELDSRLASERPSEGISSEPVSSVTTQTMEWDSSEVGNQHSREVAKQMAEKSHPEAPAKTRPTKRAQRTPDSPSEFGKVTRMCFAVFLCFALSYIPFLLLNILDVKAQAPRVVHMLAANLTWLNSCINPVLYAAMNRQFRQAYGSLLKRGSQCFRRLHQNCVPSQQNPRLTPPELK